ncbi:MAG: hypothetical protein K2K70_08790, partial [Lachnospiraceae bacterium]|nr:hypothetical protein [Lachnospiraceae bacterium]
SMMETEKVEIEGIAVTTVVDVRIGMLAEMAVIEAAKAVMEITGVAGEETTTVVAEAVTGIIEVAVAAIPMEAVVRLVRWNLCSPA